MSNILVVFPTGSLAQKDRERLFRGTPHPRIAFSHETESAALRDAATLRAYLAECASGKRKEEVAVSIGADYWQD